MASFVETQGHAGDEGNFEALYSTYRSEVQRLASYLLRNAADAEDASQTVFVNVLRALRQGVRPAEPRAWLLAITRNVCFSRGRAASARPDEVELDPERLPGTGGDDTPSVDEIVGALTRMLPNQRAALILRDFRGAPHAEICELLTLSPAGAETLLARARASFRAEIQAGEQPFDCAETKALVEQQLMGSITAAERHSLRTHLRHCSPCATLARAARSSAGKVAGLVFWPGELLSRLASAFSQAPSAVHVAAAVTSTAAIATVAIPMAIMHSPVADHTEGRAAPAPGLAVSATGPTATSAASAAFAQAVHTAGIAYVSHAAAVSSGTHGHARTHGRTHGPGHAGSSKATAVPSTYVKAAGAHASPATSNGGTTARPGTTAPVEVSPHQSPPPAAATAPANARPAAVSPHSSSPPLRPGAKAKPKAKPKRAPRRGSGGRHPTDPADRMPGSQPGGAVSAPGDGGTGSGDPGAVAGSSSSESSKPSTSSTSSNGGTNGSTSSNAGTNQNGSSSSNNSGSNGNGSGGNGSNGNGSGGNSSGDNGHHKPKH